MQARRPLIATPTEDRGRLAAENPGEFTFHDTLDYVKFVSGQLRASHMKHKDVAKGGGMCASTVSNLASGKTRYPRFGTITGSLGAIGYETVIRGSIKPPPVTPAKPSGPDAKRLLSAMKARS